MEGEILNTLQTEKTIGYIVFFSENNGVADPLTNEFILSD